MDKGDSELPDSLSDLVEAQVMEQLWRDEDRRYRQLIEGLGLTESLEAENKSWTIAMFKALIEESKAKLKQLWEKIYGK